MRQLVSEGTTYGLLLQLGFVTGIGPRVGESGFGLIPRFSYAGPFEDIALYNPRL
jgi:peptide/nickel transport system substrate-binding protein